MAGIAIEPDNGVGMVVAINHRRKGAVGIALLMAMILAACSNDSLPSVKGQPTPAFSLQNLQGSTIHFPEHFKQQVVLISFWADWCPSCKSEMRDFEAMFQKYEQRGLAVLAINMNKERDKAIAFIDDLSLSYEVLLDARGEVAKAYAVSTIPSAFIINRDGDLHTRILGEAAPEIFEQILNTLL